MNKGTLWAITYGDEVQSQILSRCEPHTYESYAFEEAVVLGWRDKNTHIGRVARSWSSEIDCQMIAASIDHRGPCADRSSIDRGRRSWSQREKEAGDDRTVTVCRSASARFLPSTIRIVISYFYINIHLSIKISMYLSIHLSFYLSIYPVIHLSIDPFISSSHSLYKLSIYLYINTYIFSPIPSPQPPLSKWCTNFFT